MGELLADHTTLKLGGPADQLLTHLEATAWPDISRAVKQAPGTPVMLGHGSNVLAADDGYPGPVIRMASQGVTVHPAPDGFVDVEVQAGHSLADLIEFTVTAGFSGLECLAGIPGTVGAAPVQNTGAYGQQIGDRLLRLAAYDWRTGETIRMLPNDCGFGYRTSVFKSRPSRWTMLALTVRLRRSSYASPIAYQRLANTLGVPLGAVPPLAETSAAVLADRRRHGLILPLAGPDARQVGSVFLNPPLTPQQVKVMRAIGGPVHRSADGLLRGSAGWLLQYVGYGPGSLLASGITCSELRTLTIVAREGATAARFAGVLHRLTEQVHAATGIRLRPEPLIIGMTDVPSAPLDEA
ncbi:UDP-N-acetylmuramate dehydrogenase [Streptosporangium sandarakinum]